MSSSSNKNLAYGKIAALGTLHHWNQGSRLSLVESVLLRYPHIAPICMKSSYRGICSVSWAALFWASPFTLLPCTSVSIFLSVWDLLMEALSALHGICFYMREAEDFPWWWEYVKCLHRFKHCFGQWSLLWAWDDKKTLQEQIFNQRMH